MGRTGRWIGVAAGAAALWCGIAGASVTLAADCGGTVACHCGDRVVRDHVLTGDLGPCDGHGLRLAGGVTLDGAGHVISGRGTQDSYGLYFREVSGAVVHNVAVTGFHHGVRFRDAHDSRLDASDVFGNGDFDDRVGYGVDVAVGSSGNVLEGNAIHDNADEGVHLGSSTSASQLLANEIYDNARENVYLLLSDRNVIRGNHVWGGQNSVFVKDSSGNRIEDNVLADATLVVRADSRDNQLVDNHLLGTGVHFQLYTSEKPYRSPHDNELRGGSIRDASTCIRFSSAVANRVVGTELEDCGVQVRSESGHGPAENTLVDMAVARPKIELDAGSLLHLHDAADRLVETLGQGRPDSPPADSFDLAVKRITVPRRVHLGPARPVRRRQIQVAVENRGSAPVTIPDAATLEALVAVEAESLGACPPPEVAPRTASSFPRTVEPGDVTFVVFDVQLDCANDPARRAPAAGDYRWRAALDPSALGGAADDVPDNDVCPRVARAGQPGCGTKGHGNVETDVTR